MSGCFNNDIVIIKIIDGRLTHINLLVIKQFRKVHFNKNI